MHIRPGSIAHRALRALGLAAAALAVCLYATQGALASIGWEGNFETGNLTQYYGGPQCADPSRVSIVQSPVRQGRYAVRLQVQPGDTNVYGSSASGERCDLMITEETTEGREGREAWYAWSTLFPSDYNPTPNSGWNLFFDFHASQGGAQANLNFEVNASGSSPTLRLRAYGGAENGAGEAFTLASLARNSWYDFVLHVKWSSNPGVGFIELWLNGQRVVPFHYRPTLYQGQSAYLKVANYRAASSQASAIIQDGARVGQSYAEIVAGFPGGTWPSTAPGSSSTEPASSSTTSAPSSGTSFGVSSSIASGQTLSGKLAWTAALSGITTGSISSVDYYIDGARKWTEHLAPYHFNGDNNTLDTAALANGGHTFKVVATAANFSTATATATATVSNTSAASTSAPPAPAPSQTIASAPTTPSSTGGFGVSSSIASGQTLAGKLAWAAAVSGISTSSISSVDYYIDGARKWSEQFTPYHYNGDNNTLDTTTLANGSHTFKIVATATNFSTATATATATVSNTSAPATSAAPAVSTSSQTSTAASPPTSTAASSGASFGVSSSIASGQTLSGKLAWTATVSGISTSSISSVDYYIDGARKWSEQFTPYHYNGDNNTLDTTTLANGSHTFKVVATAYNGSTATAGAIATVSNTSAASTSASPAPAPSQTIASAPTTPSSTGGFGVSSSIASGQTLAGKLAWTATLSGITSGSISSVDYYIDGALKWTEHLAPYHFNGDNNTLDTTTLANGSHTFKVVATAYNGSTATATATATVGNSR